MVVNKIHGGFGNQNVANTMDLVPSTGLSSTLALLVWLGSRMHGWQDPTIAFLLSQSLYCSCVVVNKIHGVQFVPIHVGWLIDSITISSCEVIALG